MELYFGGAFNGKLKYVKEKYHIENCDIFFCNDKEIDFSKEVICGIDKLIYNRALNGVDSLSYFVDNSENLKNKIIICDEISSGIVPIKKEERMWREETGRVLQYLSHNSKIVCRIFCGIPTILKDE